MELQLLINGLIKGMLYGILALGFAITYNTTRILHIAYAAIIASAPFFVFFTYQVLQLPVLLAIFFALVLTSCLNLGIEFSIYKPLRKLQSSSNVMFISSVGTMIIITHLIEFIFKNKTRRILDISLENIEVLDLTLNYIQVIQVLVVTFVVVIYIAILKLSKWGIIIKAIRDNEGLARNFGIRISVVLIFVFIIAGLFGGIGGILLGVDHGFDPYIGLPLLVNALIATIIGGLGRFYAPFIGGLIIGIFEAFSISILSGGWHDVFTYLLLLLFLLFRPNGFFGQKLRLT